MWLVTGATGRIGNVLVRNLPGRGEKVRALIVRGESVESIEGLRWRRRRGIRGVFHK